MLKTIIVNCKKCGKHEKKAIPKEFPIDSIEANYCNKCELEIYYAKW
jgi:hypothetical protein